MDSKEKQIGFWDGMAQNYDRVLHGYEKKYQKIIMWMKEELRHSGYVLEIATGTGKIALSLCDTVEKVEACDISSNMLAIAREKAIKEGCNNIHFDAQDVCALSYKAETFDAVIISNALHIIDDPKTALKGIKSVLKPNGILIAPTFLHGETWVSRIISKLMSFSGFQAYNKWTRQDFIKFIEDNGYTVVKEKMLDGMLPLIYVVAEKSEDSL